MVEYTPPPADLSRLNFVQRYMQKGSLDWSDYGYLILVVLAYLAVRPALQRWVIGKSEEEEQGVLERASYQERRAKVGANAIRGGKAEPEDLLTADETTTSGANVTQSSEGAVVNRKAKGVKFAGPKSETEKLVDWDDEPGRTAVEGDKSDVMAWLDKWDK
ncbi:uncharacterized protein AB675_2570 [Cyphellophora attinorum]|uniref:Uncharacterized protein n=1 Tax=Cyphellophora attinorum TaxID=1664694 RepID=A0A0N1HGX7_9EURO|nr:uncharacterized protein AB675_2570 [Phialophora attinorum]KPI45017.1 hypothetical protein AB675_2570 [Phialophora attinorum]